MKNQHKDNVFNRLLKQNILFLLLEMAGAYIVTQCLLAGNQKISEAIDGMLAGNIAGYISTEFWIEIIILIVAGFVFAVIQNVSTRRFTVNMLTGFRKESGRRLMELKYRYFDSHTSAQILNNFISDSQKVSEYYSEVMPCIVTSVVSIAAILISIAGIDVVLTVLLVVIVPVMTIISRYANKKISNLTKMHLQLSDEVNEIGYDGLQGMTVVRSFNLESEMIRRIKEANARRLKYEYRRNRISAISWILSDIVTNLPGIMLGVIALLRMQQGCITAGEMTYFMLLLDRIVHPLGQLPSYFIEAKIDLVSKERLEKIMHFETEHSGKADYNSEEDDIISFDSVRFAYDEKNVLNNCSFTVKNGSNIAFVGESGSGKSTIFKLICGLYEPSDGTIDIMGKDIMQGDTRELRKHIAIVSQDSFLFPESIEWNVRCGFDEVTDEQVIQACKKARIHDFIMSLPDGYKTNVGERGDLLSGGQKQRLSIARALIKNADIILFDEPTASVDVENENEIKKALNEAAEGKTVLTIAHRLNTVKDADVIYVLKDGQIAESGTHEELIKNKGVYSRLYEISCNNEEV